MVSGTCLEADFGEQELLNVIFDESGLVFILIPMKILKTNPRKLWKNINILCNRSFSPDLPSFDSLSLLSQSFSIIC